jgi:hypothetical protein
VVRSRPGWVTNHITETDAPLANPRSNGMVRPVLGDPRPAAAAAARKSWKERFDLGPLRVGHPNAASGHERYLRPVWHRNVRQSTSVNRLRYEVVKRVLATFRDQSGRVSAYEAQPLRAGVGPFGYSQPTHRRDIADDATRARLRGVPGTTFCGSPSCGSATHSRD